MEDNKKEITYRLISAAAAAATPRNKTNRIYSKKMFNSELELMVHAH